jgi:hypothetical protein
MSLSVLHGKGCRTFTFLRQITLHPVIAYVHDADVADSLAPMVQA